VLEYPYSPEGHLIGFSPTLYLWILLYPTLYLLGQDRLGFGGTMHANMGPTTFKAFVGYESPSSKQA
jgi:hypothetical protein